MKKYLLPAFALALVLVCQLRADLYNFTFAEAGGGPTTAIGQVDVVGGYATSGYLDVTGGPGAAPGLYSFVAASGTVYGTSVNGTTLYYSPSGVFVTDSAVFAGSDPFLGFGGLLFMGSGVELNLFYDAGSYQLWGNVGGVVYSPKASGTATLTAVPDGGATVAMLGAALMGIVALRRRFVI